MVDGWYIHLLYNHFTESNLWIMSSIPPSTCLTLLLTSSPPGFCGTELLEISFAPIHLDLHLSKFCAHKWGSSWTSFSTNPCVFPRSCDFLRWAHRTQFKRNQVGRHAEAMNWEMSSEVGERPRLLAQTDDWCQWCFATWNSLGKLWQNTRLPKPELSGFGGTLPFLFTIICGDQPAGNGRCNLEPETCKLFHPCMVYLPTFFCQGTEENLKRRSGEGPGHWKMNPYGINIFHFFCINSLASQRKSKVKQAKNIKHIKFWSILACPVYLL